VETEGAESLHKSIVAKELVTLPAITSLATTLGAIQVARRAFEAGMKQNCSSVVVSDKQAVDALLRLADDERLLVEPSCGAALAVIYSGLLQASVKEKGVTLGPESTVVVVVCGGVGVDRKLLQEWTAHYKL
jgi:L-serine/L-threonine ammonia-lyase